MSLRVTLHALWTTMTAVDTSPHLTSPDTTSPISIQPIASHLPVPKLPQSPKFPILPHPHIPTLCMRNTLPIPLIPAHLHCISASCQQRINLFSLHVLRTCPTAEGIPDSALSASLHLILVRNGCFAIRERWRKGRERVSKGKVLKQSLQIGSMRPR